MPASRLKLIVLGAIGVLVLVVVALGVVFVTMRPTIKPGIGGATSIEVSDRACSPEMASVSAGTPAFSIKNTSDRAIEWEILDGVMVVAERENIAPGFTVLLTPRLEPGTYQMTCGLVGNPHGKLTVVAARGAANLPVAPKLADLVAPTAEYRVYAISTADHLATAATALAAAITVGDLASARKNAAEASDAFGQLAPVLPLVATAAAPLATGPAGVPALEKALAGPGALASLSTPANELAKAAAGLATALHARTASPHDIVAGAGAVVADLVKGTGDTHTAARLAGVRKIVELFRPLTLRADKALSNKLDGDLSAVEAGLGKSSTPPPQLADLGADLTDLLSALGLNAS